MGHAFEERHERGIFVFAEAPTEGRVPTFWLGMRAVARKDLGAFKSDSPIAITLATWLPIRHCPWCGCELARRYAKTYSQLLDADLAKERGCVAIGLQETVYDG